MYFTSSSHLALWLGSNNKKKRNVFPTKQHGHEASLYLKVSCTDKLVACVDKVVHLPL